MSGITVTHEWLEAGGAEHLTEGVMAEQHGAYYIPGFPFTFYYMNMLPYYTKMNPSPDSASFMDCSIFTPVFQERCCSAAKIQ